MRSQLTLSQPAPIYERLRQAILTLNPEEAGLTSDPQTGLVWGILVETGYPSTTSTLVALADGTASLYFSNGGGFIGCGRHPAVKEAAQDLNRTAEGLVSQMNPVEACELPRPGRIRFHVLTFTGIYTADCDQTALASGRHPLSSLFQAAQGVITQIRLLDEASNKRGWDV